MSLPKAGVLSQAMFSGPSSGSSELNTGWFAPHTPATPLLLLLEMIYPPQPPCHPPLAALAPEELSPIGGSLQTLPVPQRGMNLSGESLGMQHRAEKIPTIRRKNDVAF